MSENKAVTFEIEVEELEIKVAPSNWWLPF